MFVSGRVWGCEDIIILGHLLWVSWFGVGINEGKMTGELLPNAWTNNTLLAWGWKIEYQWRWRWLSGLRETMSNCPMCMYVYIYMENTPWTFTHLMRMYLYIYMENTPWTFKHLMRMYLDPANTSKTPEKAFGPQNTSQTPEKVLLDVQGSILHGFSNQ